MTSRRVVAVIGAALSVALFAGACSSGGSNASTTATPTTADNAVDPNAPEVNAAGDIPDNQAFVTYTDPSGLVSLQVPEGWARTNSAAAITFTDKLNSISLATAPSASAPTAATASTDEVPAIKAASTNYQAGNVSEVTRKAGTAVLITYRTDGAPDPVTGRSTHLDVERYEFWKNGTEVILTLSGPQGADNVDPWRIVTDSFGFAR